MNPRLDEYEDFTVVRTSEDDVDARLAAREHLNQVGVRAFLAAHPEYYPTPMNAATLDNWCNNRGVPTTRHNLEIAASELQLETAPPPRAPVADKWASVTLSRQDTLAEYRPSDEEQKVLAALADDKNLNDHQRKVRLEKLRLLAGAQRRALKK